jgi:two-component system response regulator PrrA
MTGSSRAPRVLVVDDERDLREVIAEQLRLDGYDVDEASNGAVALECALARRPDVVVFDYAMPVADGPALVEQLRTFLRPAPVLVGISAAERARAWCAEHGVPIFVMKPFEHTTLRKAVEEAAAKAAETRDSDGKVASGPREVHRSACVVAVGAVERDGALRDSLPASLREARIVVVDSALDAERILELIVPDLVILDDNEAHDRVRSLATANAVPVILRPTAARSSSRLAHADTDPQTARYRSR